MKLYFSNPALLTAALKLCRKKFQHSIFSCILLLWSSRTSCQHTHIGTYQSSFECSSSVNQQTNSAVDYIKILTNLIQWITQFQIVDFVGGFFLRWWHHQIWWQTLRASFENLIRSFEWKIKKPFSTIITALSYNVKERRKKDTSLYLDLQHKLAAPSSKLHGNLFSSFSVNQPTLDQQVKT